MLSIFVYMELTEKTAYTRRYKHSSNDELILTRSERLRERDTLLLVRYYYWTEIRRRRFDDVTNILADQEFFLDPRYISNKLLEHDTLYKRLCLERPTVKLLNQQYPTWNWAVS